MLEWLQQEMDGCILARVHVKIQMMNDAEIEAVQIEIQTYILMVKEFKTCFAIDEFNTHSLIVAEFKP